MIEVIQAPGANRFLADGNDTEIIVKSTRGSNYYFEVEIFINEVPFATQSWSKDGQGRAIHNLRKLYDAYFDSIFRIPRTIDVIYLTELQKRVRIIIKEIEIKTGRQQEQIILPEFYIIKNRLPAFFRDTNDLELLDYDVPEIYVPEDGLVVFPFYSNGKNDFKVEITDIATNTVLLNKSYKGKNSRVFQFNLLMKFLGLNLATNSLKIKFQSGIGIFEKRIELIRRSVYPIKQVFHLNNFGFYLCSYLRGQLEIENNLKPKSYTDATGNTVTYDIEQTYKIEVNSGYSYFNTLSEMIATSMDVRLWFNNNWTQMTAETKKVPVIKDNEFIKETSLMFSKKNITSQNNISTYNSAPVARNITVQGEENVSLRFPVSKFIDAFSDQDDELKSIFINQFTVNGAFGYFKKSGQYIRIAAIANDTSFNQVKILVSEADYFKYDPYTDRFGSPLDKIQFQLNDGSFNSNVASLTFNIKEGINAPIAPKVNVQSNYNIITDVSGSGYVTVPITITNPDGFPVTVVWSENSPKVSISNSSNSSARINVLNAVNSEQFYVKVKVTDSRGLSNEKTITFKAVNRQLSLSRVVTFSEDGVAHKEYDITISNGLSGDGVDLKFNFNSNENEPLAVIFYDTPSSQRNLSRQSNTLITRKTFNSAGQIVFSVRMQKDQGSIFDPVGTPTEVVATMSLKLQNPSLGLSVNPSNSTVYFEI